MDYTSIIGYTAAALTTIAFLPQIVKVWKSKSTGDLSLGMYVILSAGFILWLVYGVLINSPPVILANSIVLVLALSIFALKIKYG